MVSCQTFNLKVGGSRPGLCRCVVFLDKKLCFTLSLSTRVYKWCRRHNAGGGGGEVTLQWTSISSRGGVVILLVASCYRNRVKLRQL